MFGRPERLHPAVADLAVEEFLRTYRDPAARVAFSAAARNIYLEEPNGPNGFWTRLEALEPPAMFIWGDEDPLVPLAFCHHVGEALPDAHQVRAERMWPRAPGGAARGHQRPHPRLHGRGARVAPRPRRRPHRARP